jgi:hypothetical protein
MTPKDKAKELIKLYLKIVSSSEDGSLYFNNYNQTNRHLFYQRIDFERTEKSKRCALIAVDEVVAFIDEHMQGWLDWDWKAYWEQVKIEIEKI